MTMLDIITIPTEKSVTAIPEMKIFVGVRKHRNLIRSRSTIPFPTSIVRIRTKASTEMTTLASALGVETSS